MKNVDRINLISFRLSLINRKRSY